MLPNPTADEARRDFGITEISDADKLRLSTEDCLIIACETHSRNDVYWEVKAPTFPNFLSRYIGPDKHTLYFFAPLPKPEPETVIGGYQTEGDQRTIFLAASQVAINATKLLPLKDTTRNLMVGLIEKAREVMEAEEDQAKNNGRPGLDGRR